MELFWIILGYTALLGLCFWLGEHLQARRKANAPPAPLPEEACPVEPLPLPRQTAQAVTRDLERLVEQLAAQLGLDEAQTAELFATHRTCCPPAPPQEIIDLEAE